MSCRQDTDMIGEPFPEDGQGIVAILDDSRMANCYLSSELLQFWNARDVDVKKSIDGTSVYKLPYEAYWIDQKSSRMLICSEMKFFKVSSEQKFDVKSQHGSSRMHGEELIRTLSPCDENGNVLSTMYVEDSKCDSLFKLDDSEKRDELSGLFLDSMERRDFNLFRNLLQGSVDPSVGENSAIRFASLQGLTSAVEKLLQDSRVDPSALNNQAILNATINDNYEIVGLLMQDSRVNAQEAFNIACKQNKYKIAKLLYNSGKIVATEENLIDAIRNNYVDIVKLLMNDKRIELETPLFIACAMGRKRSDIINMILNNPDRKIHSSTRKSCFEAMEDADGAVVDNNIEDNDYNDEEWGDEDGEEENW